MGGLTVDFGVMARAHRVDIAAQPDAVYRKSAIAVPFRNIGFLQQLQRAAAGADEYESCRYGPPVAGLDILHRDSPATSLEAFEVYDPVLVMDRKAWLRL